ncbi:hypothetical protein J437_LFUL000436 [Ladona fulva]|uniref:peptidylprolyl isomerase n=1 Tax=Ladona fulva TaxID=123851 RepID=A0A8K0K4B2_LADFU|nr:hypothetical protein J437_LFUL000436 [Ladona fulva]
MLMLKPGNISLLMNTTHLIRNVDVVNKRMANRCSFNSKTFSYLLHRSGDQGMGSRTSRYVRWRDKEIGDSSFPRIWRSRSWKRHSKGKLCISGATLTFEVELLNIGDTPPTTNVFKEIDADKDNMLSREEVRGFLIARACWEVSEYLKKQITDVEGGEPADDMKRMLENHDKLVEEIFQHEDKDKNGFISHEEFTGPKHDEL